MKRYLSLLLIPLLALSACDSKEEPVKAKDPVIKVAESTVSVSATATSGTIAFDIENPTTKDSPSAKADQDWITRLTPSTGGINFNCDVNYADERSAVVTISYPGAQDVKVTVKQMSADENIAISPEALSFSKDGQTHSVKVTSSRLWSLSGGADWVTPSATEGYPGTEVAFKAEANPDITERTCEFTFSSGSNSVKLKVSQEAADPMTLFVDDNFKTYVLDNFDTNKDKVLDEAEFAAAKEIFYSETANGAVSSFGGITLFPNITSFVFESPTYGDIASTVTSIDLRSNKKLVTVRVTDKRIEEVQLEGLDKLESLHLGQDTSIVDLDVSSLTALKSLYAYHTGIRKLDTSKNGKLETLSVYGSSHLKTLSTSGNPELTTLNAGADSLQSIDVSKNPKLTELSLDNAKFIKNIDLSANKALIRLSFKSSTLESIAPVDCPNLQTLEVGSSNTLKTIDIHKNLRLNRLDAWQCNYLEKIIMTTGQYVPDMDRDYPSGNAYNYNERIIKVEYVDAEDAGDIAAKMTDAKFKQLILNDYDTNKDGKLSQSEANAITSININSSGISSIEGSQYFYNLQELRAYNNSITSFDPVNWQNIEVLDLSANKISGAIDLVRNKKITTLDLSNNSITALNNVPSSIVYLRLSSNKLTDLEAGYKTYLKELSVDNNELTRINVHYDEALEYLDISNNKIADNGFDWAIRFWKLTGLKTLKANNFGMSNSLVVDQELKNLTLETVEMRGCTLETLNLTGSAATLKSLDVRQSPSLKTVYVGSGATASILKDGGTTIVYGEAPASVSASAK